MIFHRVPLGEVATIERRAVSPDEIGGQERYVGLENITSGGEFESVATAGEAGLKSNKFVFDDDHVLYGKLRPYLAKIAAPDFAGICSTDILPIKPGCNLNRRYLLHFLRTPGMVAHAANNAVGINLPRLSPKVLESFGIPLPPVEVQRRIASVLDAAEALRAKRRQALAKLDSLAQAIFVDMFGNDLLKDSEWPLSCLADVVAEGTTVTYGIVQAGEEFPGGVPYIRTGDIVEGRIRIDGLRRTDPVIADKFPRSCVRAGEIVMSIRATVGTTAIVPPALDGSNLTQGTARISPGKGVVGIYLLEYLRSEVSQRWIQRQVKGATFREITLGRLREMPVLVPPLHLQQEFAAACQLAGQLRTTFEKSLNQLDGLFASLQQHAFRGEL